MFDKIQRFIKLFAQGMIYGAKVNAVGGGEYVGEALIQS